MRLGRAGRYAPSPSGDLHLGNLRTAVLAWAFARREGRPFLMRMEDLNRVQEGSAQRQLEDLAALGLDWDGEVLWQSCRLDVYAEVVENLEAAGLVYECYCTRKEIQEAPSAPHAPPGAYPGTCRDLTDSQRDEGRAKMAALSREPSLRLRAEVASFAVTDRYAGRTLGDVDDLVLRRGDGLYAYNLVAVVDDIETGVSQVVRGDDLLSSSPRQAYLAQLLAKASPWLFPHGGTTKEFDYVHVPLVLNEDGARLAKRDGAVTLRNRLDEGESIADVMRWISATAGVGPCSSAAEFLEAFTPAALPFEPTVFAPEGPLSA